MREKTISFEKLNCWKEAMELATEIYKLSNGKMRNDFGFRDQLRRSALSIASNIAEGKERKTSSEFIRFLYIAKGSAGELKTLLTIAKEVGYISSEEFEKLIKRTEKISSMLGALIKRIKNK